MPGVADPWALPGLARWLDDVVRRLSNGLAVLPADPSRPAGFLEALRARLRLLPVAIAAPSGLTPAGAIAEAFGTAPKLEALLTPVLDQDLAVVSLLGLRIEDLKDWSVFLGRFSAARAAGSAGPALVISDPPPGLDSPPEAVPETWRAALRRGDLVIWAEEHLPPTRGGLAGDLAVTLAVELCGWRLDLVAALVQASLEDLAEPVGWLSRRAEPSMLETEPTCPLAILAAGGISELQHRIWKAQLAALFPALESWRLEIVAAHRTRLRLDDHLRGLGINSVEEIELGALRFQLRRSLTRPEADRLDLLSRARNALAHRQAVGPEDTLQLLRT